MNKDNVLIANQRAFEYFVVFNSMSFSKIASNISTEICNNFYLYCHHPFTIEII